MSGKHVVVALGLILASLGAYLLFAPPAPPATPDVPPQTHMASVQDGEDAFRRYCTACHRIAAPDGAIIAGGAAQAGPNLWGVTGRQAGQADGFRYSTALGQSGIIWTANSFGAYVQDPSGFLKTATGNDRARSKMAFRLKIRNAGAIAADIYAYLEQFRD